MSGRRRSKGRRQPGKQAKAAPPAEFWRAAPEPPDPEEIDPSEYPTALINSMGTPPLPGQASVAEHYFAAVVERAAGVATAVAASAGLLDSGDD
ncbi:MAG: hypothetical protein KDB26_11180 [Microthrixaceae bacterium]|nr:hypothetical protein [Microthrixaceae bacterium]